VAVYTTNLRLLSKAAASIWIKFKCSCLYHQCISTNCRFQFKLQIEKQGKAHTIGDDLLMPTMKEVVKMIICEKENTKLSAVSSSNSTVKRHSRHVWCSWTDSNSSERVSIVFHSIGWIHRYCRSALVFSFYLLYQHCGCTRFIILQNNKIVHEERGHFLMPEWFLYRVLYSLGEMCWHLHWWYIRMYWL